MYVFLKGYKTISFEKCAYNIGNILSRSLDLHYVSDQSSEKSNQTIKLTQHLILLSECFQIPNGLR